jgi:uncharacterized Zn finger protein (UPF0148 family)
LFQKPCPRCGKVALRMLRDGLAVCEDCGRHRSSPDFPVKADWA